MPKTKILIGLLVALILSTYAAQASASVSWVVNGTKLKTTAALATTAMVDEEGELTASNATIKCKGKTLSGIEPLIQAENKVSAKSLIFSECIVTAPPACELPTKAIATGPVSVEATLEGTLAVIATFKPTTGTTFTNLVITGGECASSGELGVTGKVRVLAPTGQDERTLQLIYSLATATNAELHLGSAPATLKGSALLKLTNSKPWSFRTGGVEGGEEGEHAPGWMVNKTILTSSKALATTAALDQKATIKANGTKIVCEGKNLNTVDAEITAKTTGAAKELEFTECKAESPCSISSTKIGTLPITLEATTQGSSAVVATIKPASGTLLTIIKYEGETCAYAGNQTVTGEMRMEEPTGQKEQAQQQLNSLVTESSGELDIGGKAATLEASALLGLASGETWSLLA